MIKPATDIPLAGKRTRRDSVNIPFLYNLVVNNYAVD